MIILDIDDKDVRPLSRSVSHESLLSLRQSKIHRLSNLVPPDYHTSQAQAQALAEARAQEQSQSTGRLRKKPPGKRLWTPSRRFRKIVLYALAVYFVLTAAIAVPILVVKLRQNNNYSSTTKSDNSTDTSPLTPLATTLPNDAQYSQYYQASVDGAPLDCVSYNVGNNSAYLGGTNSTVPGTQNATIPSSAPNGTYSWRNATNTTSAYGAGSSSSSNYSMSPNPNFNTTVSSIGGVGYITATYNLPRNGSVLIRTNATSAAANVYGNLNVTVAETIYNPFTDLYNTTAPVISLSMSYNESGSPNIVSICTINTTTETALGIYIPQQLAETDYLNFSINVVLSSEYYATISTSLPGFNQAFSDISASKVAVEGDLSNISFSSVNAGTLVIKPTSPEEFFSGQLGMTNTSLTNLTSDSWQSR